MRRPPAVLGGIGFVLAGACSESHALPPARSPQLGWYAVVVPGDVDGDGLDDVLVRPDTTAEWSLVRGGPRDAIRELDAAVLDAPRRVLAVGDIDGDGSGDVFVGNSGDIDDDGRGSIRAFRDDVWVEIGTCPPTSYAERVGDVDGDGLDELVIADGARGPRFVTATLAALEIGEPVAGDAGFPCSMDWWYSSFYGCSSSVGDLDGDGRADFAAGTELRFSSGEVTRIADSSDSAFVFPLPGALGPGRTALGLLQGSRIYWTPLFTVFELEGTAATPVTEPVGGGERGLAHGSLGDLDGDGVSELLFRGRVHRVEGTRLVEVLDLGIAFVAGDLDGDGLSDVLAQSHDAETGERGPAEIRYGDATLGFGAVTTLVLRD